MSGHLTYLLAFTLHSPMPNPLFCQMFFPCLQSSLGSLTALHPASSYLQPPGLAKFGLPSELP